MSILSKPPVARLVARGMQAGVGRNAARMTEQAHARFPDYPRHAEALAIPTALGPARVTVYRPVPGPVTPAVYVNLHGGGYVLQLTEQDDPLCRMLAVEAHVVVVNVDYAVAPQHPFPEPVEQVFEILTWVAAQGDSNGWDGQRLVVGGQSAGGGLAAAAARLAFERGGPALVLQVLHYPPLDLTIPAGTKSSPLPKPMLRPWMGEVFDASYVPDVARRSDRLVSPASAADRADLTGIAPAVVIAADCDILRNDARRYADRLDAAGALVDYLEVTGADHAYDLEDDMLARRTYDWIARHVRDATTPSSPRPAATPVSGSAAERLDS